jgi:hypothetical protein
MATRVIVTPLGTEGDGILRRPVSVPFRRRHLPRAYAVLAYVAQQGVNMAAVQLAPREIVRGLGLPEIPTQEIMVVQLVTGSVRAPLTGLALQLVTVAR